MTPAPIRETERRLDGQDIVNFMYSVCNMTSSPKICPNRFSLTLFHKLSSPGEKKDPSGPSPKNQIQNFGIPESQGPARPGPRNPESKIRQEKYCVHCSLTNVGYAGTTQFRGTIELRMSLLSLLLGMSIYFALGNVVGFTFYRDIA